MKKRLVSFFTSLLMIFSLAALPTMNADAADGQTYTIKVVSEENYDYAYEVLQQLNQLRSSLGVPELTMDKDLLDAAMQRAAEISVYYNHTRPNGESCFTVYRSGSMGENIAAGYTDPSDVMTGWTNSSGHYANMINSSYRSVGIGCFTDCRGTLCWVQYFSSKAPTAVTKSGSQTVSHTIQAKSEYLDLNDSIGSFNPSYAQVGDKFNYRVLTTNVGWSYAVQEIFADYTYSSTDPKVISIDSSGICTVKGCGDTTISLKSKTNSDISFSRQISIPHKYTTKVVAPTCAAQGYTLHTCSKCGNSYKDTYVNATGHKFGSWTTTKTATCTTDGTQTRKCSVCGKTETKTVAKTGHSYTTKVVAPTCTEKGYTLHTCSKCGNSYKDTYVNATGHKFGSWTTTKTATCTTDGTQKRKCSVCGKTETKTIAKTGHTVVTDKAVAATCTSSGKTEGSHCSKCGTVIKAQTTIPAKGHKFGSWTTTKSATCTTDGTQTRKCSVCGKAETKTIAKTGHSYTTKAVAPTCTEKGYTLHTCSKCGDSYKDTYVNATGHKFGSWTVTKPATATAQGVETRKCSVCGKTETRNIPALGSGTVSGTAKMAMSVKIICADDGKEVYSGNIPAGKYTLPDVDKGNYKVTFYVKNSSYVERTYSLSVSGNVTLNPELHLLGDVNGDGKISTADVGRLNAHIRKTKLITDEYDKKVADVNKDGKLTTADTGKINSHAREVTKLW